MQVDFKIAILGVVTAAAGGGIVWSVLRRRPTPEERERRRRLEVNATGRLGDAMITEVTGETVFYSYSVHGVHYGASQDIGHLREFLPASFERLIGPAGIKYAGRNPANSILLCEEWSGLRSRPSAVSVHREAVGHQAEDAALAERVQG